MSEKNFQSDGLTQCNSIDLPGYNGGVPVAAIKELEREAAGIMHGTITLTLHIKDGNLIRFTTSRERSFISGKEKTGTAPNTNTESMKETSMNESKTGMQEKEGGYGI